MVRGKSVVWLRALRVVDVRRGSVAVGMVRAVRENAGVRPAADGGRHVRWSTDRWRRSLQRGTRGSVYERGRRGTDRD
jgi:DMSO/TMAO reductase YedYZ molybdopterin-dependent catalytic subunit